MTFCSHNNHRFQYHCSVKKKNRITPLGSLHPFFPSPSTLRFGGKHHVSYLHPSWPLFFPLSLLCNAALRSTALLPSWPMEGRDKGMNKVDVAKRSLGDLSGCENLGRHRGAKGQSHADMLGGGNSHHYETNKPSSSLMCPVVIIDGQAV